MAGLRLTPVSFVRAHGMRFARFATQCVNQTSLANLKVSVT